MKLVVTEKHGTSHHKQINRLNRIEGQIRGISKMVTDERYCVDIVNQIKAVRSALHSVENAIVEDHLNHCVHRVMSSQNKRETEKIIKEIKDLLKSSK